MEKTKVVQIGMDFYYLKYAFSIEDAKELMPVLNKYDVKLLKEAE